MQDVCLMHMKHRKKKSDVNMCASLRERVYSACECFSCSKQEKGEKLASVLDPNSS